MAARFPATTNAGIEKMRGTRGRSANCQPTAASGTATAPATNSTSAIRDIGREHAEGDEGRQRRPRQEPSGRPCG